MRRLLAGVALLAGCATYTPVPVSRVAQLETYDARALDDPALRAWFDSLGVAAPSAAWNPRQLAIAALWLRADRGVREARIREADAALVSAGARPQPGLSTDIEYAFTDPQADSRWGLALAALFTVELGGKHGARLGRARAGALAARARVREEEWQQTGDVYRAALDFEEARRTIARATGERRLLDSMVELARARFDAGSLTRLDLSRLQGDQRAALVEEQRAAEGARVARRALAGVVGLPARRDSVLEVAPTQWPPCGGDNADRAALQRSAL
ncbi:MAG TPA: TolC family protein, partial [Gemmatimonadales bacterium]|nr:TolC family protein [Gemmatimonadales bacterium]